MAALYSATKSVAMFLVMCLEEQLAAVIEDKIESSILYKITDAFN